MMSPAGRVCSLEVPQRCRAGCPMNCSPDAGVYTRQLLERYCSSGAVLPPDDQELWWV
jgi:hypothetical protein